MSFEKKMMKPRTIYIEPQEDVDEISAKIRACKNDSIALVVPLKSIIFQSIISVKILRNNSEKAKKDISIITRDTQGRAFAKRLGIPNAIDLEHLESPAIQKRHITAKKEGGGEQKEKKIRSRSFTLKTENKEQAPPIDIQKKKQEILELLSRPSKFLLFSICAVSLALLFFVTTLALPGATILISPQKKVVKTTINVTLTTGPMENSTDSWRQHVLAAIPIESLFEKTIPFETVTKVFTGKNASGNIVIINNLEEEVSLRPQTRLQSDSGLIFRTLDWVRILPRSEKTIAIEADERDIFGGFIGAKGNLEKNQRLSLPGLESSTQEYLYGELREPLSGGVSGHVPLVTEKDIELAKVQIRETILRDARKDSELFTERKNKLEGRDLILLPGEMFLDTEILEIEIPENIVDKNIDSFSVRSRMRVKMLSFSEGEMLSILRGALINIIDPGMELISVEESGVIPEVLEVSSTKDRVKASVSIKGVQAYIIEPRTKNGVEFVNRVKTNILGEKYSQAKKIIENFPEVAIVEISLWPPIFQRVPRLPENISVKLLE